MKQGFSKDINIHKDRSGNVERRLSVSIKHPRGYSGFRSVEEINREFNALHTRYNFLWRAAITLRNSKEHRAIFPREFITRDISR